MVSKTVHYDSWRVLQLEAITEIFYLVIIMSQDFLKAFLVYLFILKKN